MLPILRHLLYPNCTPEAAIPTRENDSNKRNLCLMYRTSVLHSLCWLTCWTSFSRTCSLSIGQADGTNCWDWFWLNDENLLAGKEHCGRYVGPAQPRRELRTLLHKPGVDHVSTSLPSIRAAA